MLSKLYAISKWDNSCYIWSQLAFNDKVVIAHFLMQLENIFLFSDILLLFQKMRNSDNISYIALGIVR